MLIKLVLTLEDCVINTREFDKRTTSLMADLSLEEINQLEWYWINYPNLLTTFIPGLTRAGECRLSLEPVGKSAEAITDFPETEYNPGESMGTLIATTSSGVTCEHAKNGYSDAASYLQALFAKPINK